MSLLSRLFVAATVTFYGCLQPKPLEVVDEGISVRIDELGNEKIIDIYQRLALKGFSDAGDLESITTIQFSPARIQFHDYPTVPELQRSSFLSTVSNTTDFPMIVEVDEELQSAIELPFSLPYSVQGRQLIDEDLLPVAVQSGLSLTDKVSLNSVSVRYDKTLAYEIIDIQFTTGDSTERRYSDGKIMVSEVSGSGWLNIGRKGLIRKSGQLLDPYLNEDAIKNLSDELLYQLVEVEGIEGMVLAANKKDETSGGFVTHLSLGTIEGWGLGQTFDAYSSSSAALFFSSAASGSDAAGRYSVKLFGRLGYSQ